VTHLEVIREIRRKLAVEAPPRVWSADGFATVTLPERDCDVIRDLLIAERPWHDHRNRPGLRPLGTRHRRGIDSVGGDRYVIVDPFQESEFRHAGWEMTQLARLDSIAILLRERSRIALPRLVAERMSADAAFVEGSHVFHNVFVDLYYLQKIVRPGGLVVLVDYWWPRVATARSSATFGALLNNILTQG
jgi:hypothetical protein